ncbi:hypothetical protein ACJX0J_037166 [Zea mays]
MKLLYIETLESLNNYQLFKLKDVIRNMRIFLLPIISTALLMDWMDILVALWYCIDIALKDEYCDRKRLFYFFLFLLFSIAYENIPGLRQASGALNLLPHNLHLSNFHCFISKPNFLSLQTQ